VSPRSRSSSPARRGAHRRGWDRLLAAEQEFDNLAASLISKLRKEINRRRKLQTNLKKDLTAHGNPAEHKRLGDLLLANLSTATRAGNIVRLQDYYTEGAPTIEVEIDENATLQEGAGKFFSRYTKAKRAVGELGARLQQLQGELDELEEKLVKLQRVVADRDQTALAGFAEAPKATAAARGKKQKAPLALPGKEYMEHAKQLWEELKLPALSPKGPWHGYTLGDWTQTWERFAKRTITGDWEANGLETIKRRREDVSPETPTANHEKL